MSGYPKRESYFAHRFCRLLTKSAIAQEIGPTACWLLTVIAHQEDAKRYTGPVTFYNDQLMPLVGTSGNDTFDLARKKAIRAGLLHYEKGSKGVPGKYWVLIPSQYELLSDAPCDESDSFLNQEYKSDSFLNQDRKPGRNRKENPYLTNLSLSLSLNDHDALEVQRIASHTLERLGNPAGDSRIVHQAAYLLAAGGITEDDVADSVRMTIGKAKQNPLAYFRRCLQGKISEPRFTDLLHQVPAQFTRPCGNGQQSRPKRTIPQLQRPSDE